MFLSNLLRLELLVLIVFHTTEKLLSHLTLWFYIVLFLLFISMLNFSMRIILVIEYYAVKYKLC